MFVLFMQLATAWNADISTLSSHAWFAWVESDPFTARKDSLFPVLSPAQAAGQITTNSITLRSSDLPEVGGSDCRKTARKGRNVGPLESGRSERRQRALFRPLPHPTPATPALPSLTDCSLRIHELSHSNSSYHTLILCIHLKIV